MCARAQGEERKVANAKKREEKKAQQTLDRMKTWVRS